MDAIRDHGRRLAHKLHPAESLRSQRPRPEPHTPAAMQLNEQLSPDGNNSTVSICTMPNR